MFVAARAWRATSIGVDPTHIELKRASASSQWLTSTVALCRRAGGFLAKTVKIGNFLHGRWVLSAGAPEENSNS